MTTTETANRVPSSFWDEARSTFLHWEQLRILYNAVLVMLTCSFVFGFKPEMATDPVFWLEAFAGAVGANLCFFLGPIADCYIRWLGYRSQVVTYGVFGVGMAFACLVTLVASALTVNPNT
jgi:hypothetical protein